MKDLRSTDAFVALFSVD